MMGVIAAVFFACYQLPAIAWTYPETMVVAYAQANYTLTDRQVLFLKFCINHPQPGDHHGYRLKRPLDGKSVR